MFSFPLRIFFALLLFISAITVRADLPVVYDVAIGDSNPANQSGWTSSGLTPETGLETGRLATGKHIEFQEPVLHPRPDRRRSRWPTGHDRVQDDDLIDNNDFLFFREGYSQTAP